MQWDRLKLKFPMKIGGIVQKVALARFSRTFSGLDRGRRADARGDRHHRPARPATSVIEKAMDDVRESVKKGGTLTAADDARSPRPSRSWSPR